MTQPAQNQVSEKEGKPLIEFFLREAQGCADQNQKAKIFHEIGDIYRTHLGDIKQAESYYTEACALNPKSSFHLKSLYQTKLKQGLFQEALRILFSLAQILESDLQADPQAANVRLELFSAYMEAAQVLFFKLKEKDTSLKILEKILTLDPMYRPAQEHLDLLLRENGDWTKLAQCYVQWGELAQESESKNIFYFQACQIFNDFLSDVEKAESLLGLIIKTQPQFLPALNLLKQIYERRPDWPKLAETLEKMTQAVFTPAEKNQLCLDAGHLWLVRVGDLDRAAANFEQVLKDDPKSGDALLGLRKIYSTRKSFPDLIRVLTLSVSAADDPQVLRTLRYALAEAYEAGGNLDQAITHYQFILNENPLDWPTLRTLGVHFVGQGAWQKLADLYEIELKKTEQPAVILSITLRLAVIYERDLNEIPKAIACVEKAFELWPQNVLLLWEMQRLYAQNQNWEGLYQCLKKEMDLVSPERKKVVLAHLAQLCTEKLDRRDESSTLYQDILRIDPSDMEAFRNLQDLFEHRQQWTELTQVIGQQITQTQDSASIVGLYLKAADVFDQKLNQFESALFCYQKALELAPQHLPILQALGGLFHRRGEWTHLVGLYQQELQLFKDPREQSRIYFRMGEICEKHLQDDAQAVQFFQQALALKPDEDIFIDALRRCFEKQNNWTAWLELTELVGRVSENPNFKAAQHLAMAHVYLEQFKDQDKAQACLEAAYALNPKSSESLLLLMDILRRKKDFQNLKVMIENLLAQAQEPTLKVALQLELADLAEHQFKDRKGALKCWEAILKLEPRNMLALNQSERILRSEGNWDSLIKVLTYRLNLALSRQSKKEAINVVEELAIISLFQLNDIEKTALFLQKILEMDGSRLDVYGRLIPLLEQLGRWEKLAEVLRVYLSLLPTDDHFRERRIEVLIELSQIYEKHLHQLAEATGALQEALKLDPKNLFLFKRLERLYIAARDFSNLGDLYERFSDFVLVKEEKVRMLILAGEIFAGAQAQFERAQRVLEKAVGIDPGQTKAWEALKTLYEKQSDHTRLVGVNSKLLEIYRLQGRPPADCAQILVQNAGMYETHLLSNDEAIRSFREALSFTPTDFSVVKNLIRLFRGQSKWPEVLEMYGHWLEKLEDPMEAIAPYFERGVVLQEQLQQADYAIAHFEKALAIEPRHVASLEQCCDIFVTRKQWKKARTYLDRWVAIEVDKERKIKALLLSGQVFHEGTKEVERALEHYEQALIIDPAHGTALERLSGLYEAKGDWKNLVVVLERSLSQIPSTQTADIKRLRMKIAHAYANGLNDKDRAVTEYREILKAHPTFIDAQVELARVFSKGVETGNATAAIKEYRNVLQLNPLHFDSYRALAKIYEKLGQYDKIFCLYRMLEVFGSANSTEEGFLSDNRLKIAKDFKAPMADEDRGRFLFSEDTKHPPRKFLNQFAPFIDRVFANQFDSFGFKKSDRLTPQSKNPIRDLCDRLAIGFGVTDFDLYVGKGLKEWVSVHFQDSPAVVVDADGIRRLNVEEQRFVLGKALLMAKEGLGLMSRMKDGELKLLMATMRKGYHAQATKSPAAFNGREEKLFSEIDKAISRKARKGILEFAEKMKAEDEKFTDADFRKSIDAALMRSGLVACCDFGVALSALVKSEKDLFGVDFKNSEKVAEKIKSVPFLKDFILFAASDEYFALRKKLGVALV